MHVLWILVVGLLLGAFAKFVVPAERRSTVALMLVGVTGSAIGYYGGALGLTTPAAFSAVLGSVVGATLLLALYRVRRHSICAL